MRAVKKALEDLELPLEQLVDRCNQDDHLCNLSEVIAAEAALEILYKARRSEHPVQIEDEWTVWPDKTVRSYDSREELLMHVDISCSPSEKDARAHLIDADPDLLEALVTMCGEFRHGEATGATGVLMLPVSWADLRKARAAIAKATGEQA